MERSDRLNGRCASGTSQDCRTCRGRANDLTQFHHQFGAEFEIGTNALNVIIVVEHFQ